MTEWHGVWAGVQVEGKRPQRWPAVGGGCQSGWGRLLSVTNAIEAGAWRQGDSGWASAERPWMGVGVPPAPPSSNASLGLRPIPNQTQFPCGAPRMDTIVTPLFWWGGGGGGARRGPG